MVVSWSRKKMQFFIQLLSNTQAMRNCGEKSSRRAESWIHVYGMAARQGPRCVAWVFAQGNSYLKESKLRSVALEPAGTEASSALGVLVLWCCEVSWA